MADAVVLLVAGLSPRSIGTRGHVKIARKGYVWVETRMRGDQQNGDGPPANMPSAILYRRKTGAVRRVPAVGMCLAKIMTGMRKIHFFKCGNVRSPRCTVRQNPKTDSPLTPRNITVRKARRVVPKSQSGDTESQFLSGDENGLRPLLGRNRLLNNEVGKPWDARRVKNSGRRNERRSVTGRSCGRSEI